MKPVRFHPEAEAEMMSAAKFYETQQKDLEKRFLASVQDALNRIQVNPLLYHEIEDSVRRCLTRRSLSVSFFGSCLTSTSSLL